MISNKDPIAINAWKEASAIIRVNKLDVGSFSSVGIEPTKVHYVPNGFDADAFSPRSKMDSRKKLGLPLDGKILLNVANFYSEVKGHKVLLEIIKKVVAIQPDVYCVMVGDGALKDSMMKMTDELGISDHILFAGSKTHKEIPDWINACDMFILPSLMEGNPP